MSRRSLTANTGLQQRKIAKRAARRAEHIDKYAERREDSTDSEMSAKLAELVAHFNGAGGHYA